MSRNIVLPLVLVSGLGVMANGVLAASLSLGGGISVGGHGGMGRAPVSHRIDIGGQRAEAPEALRKAVPQPPAGDAPSLPVQATAEFSASASGEGPSGSAPALPTPLSGGGQGADPSQLTSKLPSSGSAPALPQPPAGGDAGGDAGGEVAAGLAQLTGKLPSSGSAPALPTPPAGGGQGADPSQLTSKLPAAPAKPAAPSLPQPPANSQPSPAAGAVDLVVDSAAEAGLE